MGTNWFWTITLVVATTAAVLLPIPGEEPKPDPNLFMVLKLKNAQQVLDGLALADFARIEEAADYLVRLSKKAEFQKKDVPDYERFNEDFRRSAETLLRAARAKNLDAAGLAYVRLSMNCVECHKHLREAK